MTNPAGDPANDTPGRSFAIPEEAIFFLLLQRARYRWQPLYRLFSLLGAGGIYKRRITRSFIETRRAATIGRLYRDDVDATLDLIQPWLPARVETVVDIGCGLGGFSLGLWLRFPDTLRKLYLLDRSAMSRDLHFGFRGEAAFYNSLAEAERFLLLNGVPGEVIHTVDVGKDPYPEPAADVVISTFAWGFHFPVGTYVEEVRTRLRPDGIVALHVRQNTDGDAVLARHFEEVHRIRKGRSSHLVVARHPRT